MKEIEISISKLANYCNFSTNTIKKYVESYRLTKWIKRKHKPITFSLNDQSIKDFKEFLLLLDKGNYKNRIGRFNRGIEQILKP